jgi:hypothetical protein
MRHLPALLLVALLAACSTATSSRPTAVSGATATPTATAAPAAPEPSQAEFLLDSAASDFRIHPPLPMAFRNVRYGQFTNEDDSVSHRLCGEYQVAKTDAPPEWVPFATLKTSGYEQWLGDTAYCKGDIHWTPGDLSAELQRRFDATR